MDISISEHLQEHINQKIQSGKYRSSDEVLEKALALLDEHDEGLDRELADVHAKVQEGIEALQNGDYTEYTSETLHQLFNDVKQRGRERRSHNSASCGD